MRQHKYKGLPFTCMWCGRKLQEITLDVVGPGSVGPRSTIKTDPPAVGSPIPNFPGLTVREIEPRMRAKGVGAKTRPVVSGELPEIWRIHVHPVRYAALYSPARDGQPEQPVFDTPSCAKNYGLWVAGLIYSGATLQP